MPAQHVSPRHFLARYEAIVGKTGARRRRAGGKEEQDVGVDRPESERERWKCRSQSLIRRKTRLPHEFVV
jgi:hypothetical protein